MGALTEPEIFDRMSSSLREAGDCCMRLAAPRPRGQTYDSLRRHLRFAGDCCRQAAYWRDDARWLTIDHTLSEAHRVAGGWLRGYRDESGRRVMYSQATISDLFMRLAQNIAMLYNHAADLRDKATGRTGTILPIIRQETRTQGRPIQVLLPSNVRFVQPLSGAVH